MAQAKYNTSNLMPALLCLGFLCIGFVPNWGAVDKIAPQWLGLSILNLASLVVLLSNPSYFSVPIGKVVRTGISLFYLGFFTWAALSYFYAINPTEVVVNLARQANTVFMYLHLSLFVYGLKDKIKWVSWTLVLILGIEIYAILVEAYQMSQTPQGITPGALKGVTANRNIGAFSMAIKIPFALFILHFATKRWVQIGMSVLIFATLFGLSLISSRASYVAVLLISLLYLGLVGFQYYQKRKWKQLIPAINIVLPLLLAVLLNQVVLSGSRTVNALERASTISVSTNDGSVNQRLRYYEDVLTHMLANPILGTGLGNWKLMSIDYDKNDIRGYVVPYHAHSDFIQLGAELGFIGFFLYLGVFLFAAFTIFKILFSNRISEQEKFFVFFLLMALGVYSIDANLNFPIARPQVLAPWAMVMALISFYYIKSNEKEAPSQAAPKGKTAAYGFGLLGILLFVPTLSVSNTVYTSLQAQMTILRDFNSNQFNVPLNQIESFVPSMPNITVTTIPMDAIKARYYFHYKKYDKALEHLEVSRSQNPYLMYPELLTSQIYAAKGELQQAKAYAEKAFYNLPNNNLHSSVYLQLLTQTRDREGLNKAFELLTQKNDLNNWKNYLVSAANLFSAGDSLQTERGRQALLLFPENQEIQQLYRQLAIGPKRINEALNYSTTALAYFNQSKHDLAAIEFEKAIAANPLEYSYRENAATSYYLLGDLDKALKQIDVVIKELNPLDGKCEYIKALIYIKLGDPVGACPLLQTAKDSGYPQAEATYQQYCR